MPTLNDKLDEIKRQKDLYILPQNLKKDVTVFGVTGTLEAGSGEDLEAEISAQEEYIAELETIIDAKAQGESTPNIFLQTTEPTKKDGIWLQVANKEYEKVVAKDSVVEEPSWLPDGTIRTIPYDFKYGSAVAVGTDIYLLGGGSSDTYTYNYKYDTLTNTYTKMSNMPYSIWTENCAASIGTDIYIFFRERQVYKYNTLNDTYTQLASKPVNNTCGATVVVGTDIYTIGGVNESGSKPTYMYKYDTINNTWTKLTDIPVSFFNDGATAINTDIYLMIGESNQSYTYKYNTITDTYTQLSSIPVYCQPFIVNNNGNIIVITKTSNNLVYEYIVSTDTYVLLPNIPYTVDTTGSVVSIDNSVYVIGGNSYPTKVQVLEFPSSDFDDKSIVLLNGSTYKTQLYSNDLVDNSVKYTFNDVWLYEDENGLITDIPTYYGNGTNWINIKNPPVEGAEE